MNGENKLAASQLTLVLAVLLTNQYRIYLVSSPSLIHLLTYHLRPSHLFDCGTLTAQKIDNLLDRPIIRACAYHSLASHTISSPP